MSQVVEADLTWIRRPSSSGFETGIRIEIDDAGHIRATDSSEDTTLRLDGQALLPGFVNAHSHSFQIGLRGLGERFTEGMGSFWSWRNEMYGLIEGIDSDTLLPLARRAFQEMRAAGITTVGEFHYLHHSAEGQDFALDDVILAAAREAGIRVALLEAYYRTGGIDRPLEGSQIRFGTDSLEEYWSQMDTLASQLDPATQSLGAVAHSIRAAEPDEIAALHAEARRRDLVLHMHLEEQPAEIEESLVAYGKTPMAAVTAVLPTCEGLTAVHCTHSDEGDMDRFLDQGGRVCVCPLTEGNLGDGLAELSRFGGGTDRLSLGTDSNARISMIEEMRWLELGQRLRNGSRGVLTDADGHAARELLSHGTSGGAAALGIEAGDISPGKFADFVAIDLAHPSLDQCETDTLLDAIVFGTGNEVIQQTAVGGEWVEHRRASD